ncbi:pyrroline-5-carboxylate reductase [Belliella kenyensis]|uniref:Pyrroline-5-carboxylate reductase n=1 Tax=Belliella kenyensis TaxID=1472724 RepID=A0ABV8EQR3_9BACT|nr:pyrroline-5-carboxylate reductase [Belliella kenyensis]MCH7403388.1 pyrroline-5-carboxylate reductase [Belliella kenyensis]MDN3601600.1 pyrroline-5-carboxylate reductase [Belliella kenyensis]
MIQHKKIAIIGCGNLGTSIANGLLEQTDFAAQNLHITKRNPSNLLYLQDKGVRVHSDNVIAASESDIIILGVKPYNVASILRQINPALDPKRHTIISLATGITLDEMYEVVDPSMVVYRAMPNIAADINESITCICGRNNTLIADEQVKNLFNSIGFSITIDEALMEAATVLGACGIAYVLRFMRAMIQGGIQIGFDAKTASLIVNQTVKGAAELMIQKDMHPEQAIDKVTTPKGCTIVGLNEMEHQGFSSAMVRGVLASYQKIAKD